MGRGVATGFGGLWAKQVSGTQSSADRREAPRGALGLTEVLIPISTCGFTMESKGWAGRSRRGLPGNPPHWGCLKNQWSMAQPPSERRRCELVRVWVAGFRSCHLCLPEPDTPVFSSLSRMTPSAQGPSGACIGSEEMRNIHHGYKKKRMLQEFVSETETEPTRGQRCQPGSMLYPRPSVALSR